MNKPSFAYQVTLSITLHDSSQQYTPAIQPGFYINCMSGPSPIWRGNLAPRIF